MRCLSVRVFPLERRGGIRQSGRMLAKVCSAAVQGIEAYPVEVEVNVGWGDSSVVMLSQYNPLFYALL